MSAAPSGRAYEVRPLKSRYMNLMRMALDQGTPVSLAQLGMIEPFANSDRSDERDGFLVRKRSQ
jgi:hypothetical protein